MSHYSTGKTYNFNKPSSSATSTFFHVFPIIEFLSSLSAGRSSASFLIDAMAFGVMGVEDMVILAWCVW